LQELDDVFCDDFGRRRINRRQLRHDVSDAPLAIAKPQHRRPDRIDFVNALRRENDEAFPRAIVVQAREAREGRSRLLADHEARRGVGIIHSFPRGGTPPAE
jgi:hypothetical protein